MDQWTNQLSNVSLYDMKAYVRKAQNAVLNFSEMEAKVREATNNEPWGTPTSTMQQIAEGTNNYQQFHEIMPFIYRRFTEKSAAEWRQIYKALQLLDYLVRNGSERVVDYARSHISVIEMLRHFSYVDRHGTDQGASIRKRADELVGLLGSTDKLRAERKRSRQLNQKTGLASGVKGGGFGGSGRKYGGFSSDSYRQMTFGGSAPQQVFGDGGGFDGSNHIVAGAARDDDDFEEYDAGDAADVGASSAAGTARSAADPAGAAENEGDDDDFADFQTAPTASGAAASSSGQPLTSTNILDLFSAPPPAAGAQPSSASGAAFASLSQPPSQPQQAAPLFSSAPAPAAAAPAKKAPVDDAFGSLWETSKTASFSAKPTPAAKGAAATTSTTSTTTTTPNSAAPGLSSQLQGSQGSQPPASGGTGGEVDLLSF